MGVRIMLFKRDLLKYVFVLAVASAGCDSADVLSGTVWGPAGLRYFESDAQFYYVGSDGLCGEYGAYSIEDNILTVDISGGQRVAAYKWVFEFKFVDDDKSRMTVTQISPAKAARTFEWHRVQDPPYPTQCIELKQ